MKCFASETHRIITANIQPLPYFPRWSAIRALILDIKLSRIVCIEVLLFHAGKDITQEKNGRDETPLDVARRIGDDTVILALQGKNVYRRRIALATRTPHSKHLRGQGSLRSRLENGVDVQRIMAVWEKFFENAAIACLEPKKNHSSIDEGKNNVEGVAYGVVQLDDSQGVEELIKKEERSVVSREGRRWGFGEDSNEGGTDIQRHQDSDEIKMSNLPEASADVASGLPSCVLESLDNSLDQSGVSNHSLGEFAIKWTEVHPFQNAAHGSNTLRGGRGGCDEDSTGGRPGNRRHQDSEDTRISNLPEAFADASSGLGYYVLESLDNSSDQSGASKDSRGDFTTQCGEEHSVQNAAHGSSTPASDDTYLFQSPKGSTGEWAWSPEIHQSTFQITPGKSTKTDVLSDGSSLPDKRWIACWDSASKLIYFWNLETGESSWEAPPTTDGTEFSSSLLWDPQHRAFFAVDEWGSSHWIENSPVTSVTLAESHMGVVGNTIGQATAVENGTTEAQQWAPAVSQELEVITSPQNEGSNTFHAIGDGEAWFWDVHLNDNGNGHPINPSKYSPEYEKKAVETQRVCNSLDEFFDAQEYFSCVSSSPNTKARVTGCASIDRNGNAQATEEEMRSSVNPVSSVSKNTEEEVESVEKIDSRTCYDEKQPESSAVDCVEPYQTNQTKNSLGGIGAVPELSALPAWLLWCAQSPDTPTYYVNEETNISSWLLPPEAVVQSCGWLRAWSEEFQSYFYANHWTGRVTWELKDFDVTSEKMRMYDPSLSMK